MSHHTLKLVAGSAATLALALAGIVTIYRKATDDAGGSYDPARPR